MNASHQEASMSQSVATLGHFGAEELVLNAAVLLEDMIRAPAGGEGQHEWRWSTHHLYRLAIAGLPEKPTTVEDFR
jgi:hypothetical protein